MSNLIIELFDLNNAPLIPSGRIDGVENFTVTYRKDDENNNISSSYTSELIFYDDGYKVIYDALINNPTGFSEKIKVNIYDKCCNSLVFTGYIKGDSIDWCENKCSVTANIIYEDSALSCIKNTMIWDNWNGFLSRSYNRIDYCIENRPNFIQVLLYIIGGQLVLVLNLLFYIVYAVLVGIIAVFWVLCSIVALINPFDDLTVSDCPNPGEVAADWILDALDEINEALIPCKNYHTAPYLRQYIKNACDKCGLNFKSSILNDQSNPVGSIYYNTVLLSMQVKEGRGYYSNNNDLILDNVPLETLETLFRDYLNPLFNARWRIIGNDLIFERKDYFYAINPWIDANQLLNDGKIVDNNICWTWIDKERYAYGRYEYTMDAMEYIGNEAKNQYNDIVDWNTPNPSASQAGYFELKSQFSPIRTVKDQFNSLYNNNTLWGTNQNQANIANIQRQMLVAQHTAFNYKIFIYTGDNLRPVKGYNNEYNDSFTGINIGVPTDKRINYPFWFVEGIQGVSGAQNNLYSLFHYIDNPRLPGAVQYNFDFKFEFDCSQYLDFAFDKYVSLKRGPVSLNGKITEIEVDFNKRIIQVKGVA